MSYEKFERSVEKSEFQDYSLSDGTIAWIDILGVRSLPHEEISKTMRKVLDIAAEATSTGGIWNDGVLVGTPNKAAQYAIVGDTIVMVEQNQPATRPVAKLALFYRAGILSKKLFDNGLLHRGVIVEGPVDCFQKDHNPVITGAGAIEAYSLEKKLNCTGMFIHKSCLPFFDERGPQLNKQNTYISVEKLKSIDTTKITPNVGAVMYNLSDGFHSWQSALKNAPAHEKVDNSRALLDSILEHKSGKP